MTQAYRSTVAITLLFALEVLWCTILFAAAIARGWFTRSWMLTDAALQAVVTVAVGRLCDAGQATQTVNWSVAPLVGASILASLFLSRPALFAVTAVLIGSYLIGVAGDLPGDWANALSNIGFVAAFTWAASLVGLRLIRESQTADAAARAAAIDERERARMEARFEERTRQYRRLHDTVLSTLEGIARGGLDYVQESVRQRCASDANLVRSLNAAVDLTVLSPLPIVLASEVRAVEAFGLEVHYFTDAVPPSLPAAVVDAAAGAVREALNNVLKHAGVKEAWVTTRGLGGGGILIRVVDRGTGFNPLVTNVSGGVEGSIRRRWDRVGGSTDIDSTSSGTLVELTWTP
jgi:signal transduction histidine kinase